MNSLTGELALKKVIITYGVTSGVASMRQVLNHEIFTFQNEYPGVEISVRPRRTPHPSVTGIYRDGSERSFSLKQWHHRHSDNLGPGAITAKLYDLANDNNTTDQVYATSTQHQQRKSVQGTWNPWLWIAEGHESREKPALFKRKLSDSEWDYYVDKYSDKMRREEGEVSKQTKQRTEFFEAETSDVAARWGKYVAPSRQSDMEHNLAEMKKVSQKKAKDRPSGYGVVTPQEYALFQHADHDKLATSALDTLKSRDVTDVVSWWAKRKEQLKPPK